MDIIVEIGTDEQKQLIENELSILEQVSEIADPPPPILKIIVAQDFDETVNKLRNSDSYQSTRGNHVAVAKNVMTQDGLFLVFSPVIFTAEQDNLTRLKLYLHEFSHAYNKSRFPSLITTSESDYRYLTNLYTLYDEYDADRNALNFVDAYLLAKNIRNTSADHRYRHHVRVGLKGFIDIISDQEIYDEISSQIDAFRYHGNVMRFLLSVDRGLDEISKSIIHTYSSIDHFPKFKRIEPALRRSKFVNIKTEALIDYIRSKFDDNSPDLLDGIPIISRYMENFGIRFEDTDKGWYCHVLDI
jgi:hypothetical protein